MKPYNIYISGVGGQGIIKTSTVIGEAAMKSSMPVVMSEVHGMAQRGGGVSTELKIGDAYSPIIENGSADLLISFEPIEALRAIPKISDKTSVIVNKSPIYPFNLGRVKFHIQISLLHWMNLKTSQRKFMPWKQIVLPRNPDIYYP